MKSKNTNLKLISSGLVFLFLLAIKNYLFTVLNVDINNLGSVCDTIFKILYIITSYTSRRK